jgi:hypothetical protein
MEKVAENCQRFPEKGYRGRARERSDGAGRKGLQPLSMQGRE